MKLLALDFDGVLCDSAHEAFEVAMRTFLALRPEASIARRPREELFAVFCEVMPLGNRAEDFGVALAAIEEGLELPDQAAYDAYRAARDPAWLRRFHQRFYQERGDWARRDPAGWRATLCPYRPFLDLLRRRAGEARYAIATAKDRRSVHALLEAFGVDDLFEPSMVLDKETGVSKVAHLECLHRRFGVDWREIVFVDDKVNHLDSVSPLGVGTVLAGWGHNGPREHALARARGHRVCLLDDAEAALFGPR